MRFLDDAVDDDSTHSQVQLVHHLNFFADFSFSLSFDSISADDRKHVTLSTIIHEQSIQISHRFICFGFLQHGRDHMCHGCCCCCCWCYCCYRSCCWSTCWEDVFYQRFCLLAVVKRSSSTVFASNRVSIFLTIADCWFISMIISETMTTNGIHYACVCLQLRHYHYYYLKKSVEFSKL